MTITKGVDGYSIENYYGQVSCMLPVIFCRTIGQVRNGGTEYGFIGGGSCSSENFFTDQNDAIAAVEKSLETYEANLIAQVDKVQAALTLIATTGTARIVGLHS